MATVIDAATPMYALDMLFKYYLYTSAVACTLVLIVGGLNYVRNS